jgi:hypothetical protein
MRQAALETARDIAKEKMLPGYGESLEDLEKRFSAQLGQLAPCVAGEISREPQRIISMWARIARKSEKKRSVQKRATSGRILAYVNSGKRQKQLHATKGWRNYAA